MLLRRFTDFILKNRLRAVGTAFALAFVPLIGSVSILIAALVTLRKNAFEGALVFLAASMPLIIHYVVAPGDFESDMVLGMLKITLMSNVLIWLFAVLLRQYGNWSFVLEAAILTGIIIVGAVHLLYPDIAGWWEKELGSYLSQTVNVVDALKTGSDQSIEEVQAKFVASVKGNATGFLVVSVLFNVLLQLVVARWWQSTMFNPGGLRKELQQVRLGYITSGLFVLLALLSYSKSDFALDAMPILYFGLGMAGLSLIHYLIGSYTAVGWLWLIVVYLGIIILFSFSLVAVAIVALFDTGLDFRKRISGHLKKR